MLEKTDEAFAKPVTCTLSPFLIGPHDPSMSLTAQGRAESDPCPLSSISTEIQTAAVPIDFMDNLIRPAAQGTCYHPCYSCDTKETVFR